MDTDGKLVLGTKLDDSGFEKGVKDLEKKNTPNIDVELSSKQVQKNAKNIRQQINNFFKKEKPKITPEIKEPQKKDIWSDYETPDFIDETSFDSQINYLEKRIDEVREMLKDPVSFGITTSEIDSLYAKEEKLTNQLVQLKEKQQKFNQEINNGKKNADSLSNSMGGILKKVAKWSLAIFSVRSAYMAVRSAVGIISQYNEGIANDIEYIRYALASVLEPVIRGIVNLVAKLLQYVNYLWKAWTGKDLFKSAKNFENMKKSTSGMAKDTKQIKKNMTGFDEMNVLEDTSTDASAGAVGGGGTTFDLTSMEEFKPPKWLETIKNWGQWVIDHWQIVLGIIGATGAVFLGIKLAKFLKDAKGIKDTVGGWSKTFKGFFDGLGKAAEAIAILGGLALVIQSITDLIDTFNESGLTLGEVAGLLGIVLGELAATFLVLMGAMTLMTPSWQSIAAAAVIFAGFSAVLLTVNKLLETLGETGLSVSDVGTILGTVFGSLIALVVALTAATVALQNPLAMGGLAVLTASISTILLVVAATLPTILDACEKFINRVGPFLIELITTINEGINNTIYALGTVLPPIIQSVGDLFSKTFEGISKVIESVGSTFEKIFNGISKVIETVGQTIVKIMNTAKSLVTTVLQSILDFINKLGPAINNFVDNTIIATTKLVNFLISAIEYLVNTLIIKGVNGIIKAINSVAEYVGIEIPRVPEVEIPRFVPKLAKGGIISQPGRGVPVGYGQAIGGERGREGVIPLTDAQQMALLGEAIGKYININLTNITKLDNRQIAKEQKQINTQNDFAYNR